MFSAALLAGLLQNLIFAGGFGMTEAVRMAAKPDKLAVSAGFISLFSVSVTLACRALDTLPSVSSLGRLPHALIFSGVLAALYLAVLGIVTLFGRSAVIKRRLSVSALNTLVLSLPYISYKSAFTLPQAIGTSFGAAIAYVVAVLLLRSGIEKLNANDSLPEVFRGNGALFIYTALLSLAFAGITGVGIAL